MINQRLQGTLFKSAEEFVREYEKMVLTRRRTRKKQTEMTEKEIIEIIAEAFDDNKSINFVVKQDSKREKRIKKLVEYSILCGKNFGDVIVDENCIAIVIFPYKKKTTFSSIINDLSLIFNVIGLSNAMNVIKREGLVKKLHPKGEYANLWYIAVPEEKRGKGHGTDMMRKLDEKYKGLPIVLETSTERNFKFYSKNGYVHKGTVDQFDYDLRVYIKK